MLKLEQKPHISNKKKQAVSLLHQKTLKSKLYAEMQNVI